MYLDIGINLTSL